jgi:hypothetical protein
MKKYIFVLFVLSVFFISGCAQLNRDNIRYSAVKRGYEVYRIDGKDSLQSAKESADKEIDSYDKRLKIYKEYLKPLQCDNKEQKQDKTPSEFSKKSDTTVKEPEKINKAPGGHPFPQPNAGQNTSNQPEVKTTTPLTSPIVSQIEYIWPKELFDKPNDELIRAFSSTASVAQMRDLLTEPSLPPLLPVERTVELGCLPPPDSAVFESTANILATLKGLKIEGQAVEPTVSADFASHVVKLFEETERTVFLQYALFRLCEMSVNSPAEFRNVYPVIIHDIVRRTAEMSQLVNIEREKSRQEELRLEILKLEAPDRDKLYRMCIKAKLNAGILDVEKIIEECKKLKDE